MSEKTYKEIMMMLLSHSTEEELLQMLQEDCWIEQTKCFIREELANRRKK